VYVQKLNMKTTSQQEGTIQSIHHSLARNPELKICGFTRGLGRQ
jgi:hypothetical protein